MRSVGRWRHNESILSSLPPEGEGDSPQPSGVGVVRYLDLCLVICRPGLWIAASLCSSQ